MTRDCRSFLSVGCLLTFSASALVGYAQRAGSFNPLALLQPTVSVTAADLSRLENGEVIVRLLPAEDGELVTLAAARTTADGQRLIKWVRDIGDLKKSDYVTAIARFSSPPELADLESLHLEDDELRAIRGCLLNACDLKLTAAEIATLQTDDGRARGHGNRAELEAAMQRIVLARIIAYLQGGHEQFVQYANGEDPASPSQAFSTLLKRSAFLVQHAPGLSQYLDDYPRAPDAGVESFAYWSLEHLGGRPSLTATHVAIVRGTVSGEPEAIVAGKQIFALQYLSASLGVTMILPGRSPTEHYLVYLNRTHVDALDRWYGGLARFLIKKRVDREAARVFSGLKTRLESGDPPR